LLEVLLDFLILCFLYICVRVLKSDDGPSCCCLSCSCCSSSLNSDERLEERLRKQNEERIEKLNRAGDNTRSRLATYSLTRKKAEVAKKQVGVEFPQETNDSFEVVSMNMAGTRNPIAVDLESQFQNDGPQVTIDRNEHNIRASRLPENFRKSLQPGIALTPQMIFNMDTLQTMKKANEEAKTVPAAVIASHKALKMMGVREADVQKPFSEPVTARIERLAVAANKQGLLSGGATAGLGNQIAGEFLKKQQAAEERRAEAARAAELKKEEARIRAEISRENKTELDERRRTLRASQKMNEDDAKRLSSAASARKSAKATVNAAQNRLKDFLNKTESTDQE